MRVCMHVCVLECDACVRVLSVRACLGARRGLTPCVCSWCVCVCACVRARVRLVLCCLCES